MNKKLKNEITKYVCKAIDLTTIPLNDQVYTRLEVRILLDQQKQEIKTQLAHLIQPL